ncbi:MAG TPA: hypothetical protein VF178_05580, partial [Gemmatimonadaceae bacterium]
RPASYLWLLHRLISPRGSAMHAGHAGTFGATSAPTLIERLNSDQHELALRVFMVIVLAHWLEHLVQGIQVYVLGWPVPEARGVLGLFYPWLIKSEALHYGYALVMLAGLWILRSGFTGRIDHRWWIIAFWIQFFHHIEHGILQVQALTGHNLFDRPVPTSLVQLWVPRVELHLFYNTIVFIPMVLAMYYHLFPPAQEESRPQCSCAWQPRIAPAA